MHRTSYPPVILVTFILSGAVSAADTAATSLRPAVKTVPTAAPPGGGASPPLAVAPVPLKRTLTRQMVPIQPLSPCVTVPAALDAVLKKELETREALHAAGVTGIFKSSRGKLQGYFAPSVKHCCAPSMQFTVQDQQTAGCAGSDTLNACMDKLTRWCINKNATPLHIKEETQQQHQAVSAVGTASDEYAKKLQQLLMALP